MTQVVEGEHPVMPGDIRLDGWIPLVGTFGHRETELAALFIIEFCRQRGSWVAFTHQELDVAYAHTRDGQLRERYDLTYRMPLPPGVERHLFLFYDLVDGDMVVLGNDGKYRVTDEFIQRCCRRT